MTPETEIAMENQFDEIKRLLINFGIPIVEKIVGAIILWVVGRYVIRKLQALLGKSLIKRNFEPTTATYLESIASIAMLIFLGITILGVLGVQTTTFAALLAAAGLAIGTAWSGMLSNFAAGIFLVVLRPYKVGDMISAGGVVGDVVELGLFATTLNTGDNIRVLVGNNKIFSDNIVNYNANPFRRVDLKAQLAHGADVQGFITEMTAALKAIPKTVHEPVVEILEYSLAGPVLAVRPFCANGDYWNVYFATNKAISDVVTKLHLPVPEQHWVVRHRPV